MTNLQILSNQLFNIPCEQEIGLYVRYPPSSNTEPSYWKEFIENNDNKHQLEALKLFVESGLDTMKVSVPHSENGIFTAIFKRIKRFNDNYNDIYTYTREDGTSVSMLMSYSGQIGYINRIAYESNG